MKQLKNCLSLAVLLFSADAISQIKELPPPPPPVEIHMDNSRELQEVHPQNFNHPPKPPIPPSLPMPPMPPVPPMTSTPPTPPLQL